MFQLDRWFQNQLRRQERIVLLEDALLEGHFTAYAYFRLRYFLGRTLIGAALHIIEFLFLAHVLDRGLLTAALLVSAATSFANSWWWGALEVMREKVRRLHRDKKSHLIPAVVSGWLYFAFVCSLVLFSMAITWCTLDSIRPTSEFSVFHFYVLVILLRLCLSLLTRTFHSGVYAVRRVYRPFATIVGIDLLAFVGTLLLWPVCGVWSFPLMLLLGSITASLITLVFVGRVYRFLDLVIEPPWRRRQRRRGAGLLRRIANRDFHLAGFSYALVKFDAIIVFVLFLTTRDDEAGYEYFVVFYLLSPLIRASSDWAQLFYFDFKRLGVDLFANFRDAFQIVVARLSGVVGVVLWVASSVCGTLVLEKNLGFFYPALLTLFLLRSRLAFLQIRSFAERQYLTLATSGFLLIAGTSFTGFVASGGIEKKITCLLFFLVCAVVYLWARRRRRHRLDPPQSLSSPQDWLERLTSVREPVRIRTIKLYREVSDWLVEEFAQEISRRLRRDDRVLLMQGKRIIWFERSSSEVRVSDAWILQRGGGFVGSLRSTPYETGGHEALRRAQKERALGDGLRGDWLRAPPTLTVASLREQFEEMFPDGVVYEPDRVRTEQPQTLSAEDRRDVMYGAIRYSRNLFLPHRRGRLDVTTLCYGGTIRLIFVVTKDTSRKLRSAWRRLINQTNLQCGVHPIRTEGKNERRRPMRYRKGLWWSAAAVVITALLLIPKDDRACGSFELKLAKRAELRAPVAGFLKKVYYDEGDRVTTGTVVCHMEIPDLASRLAQRKAEARSLETILHDLKSQGEEPRPGDWARLAGLREETRYLEEVQDNLIIETPVTGLITTPRLQHQIGRYFLEGQLICEVQEPSVLDAEISLPEKRVEHVRAGQRIELKALALPYEIFHGTVVRVAPAAIVGETGSTLTAYCQVEDAAPGLRPGMTGHARISTGKRPVAAILADRVLRFVRTEFWW